MARRMDIIEVPGHGFTWTKRWFRGRNLPTFRDKILPVWAGRKATYLELGVFEGMSMTWMLQYVLTHEESRSVGVDPWLMTRKLDGDEMEEVMERAAFNLSIFPNCQLIRGNSSEVLRRMVRGGFLGIETGNVDLCMVDGNHNALAVWDDCRLVYQLLRPGGWMILDDVKQDHPKGGDHVRQGLDFFLHEFKGKMEQVFTHRYMEVYVKL